MNFGDKFKWLYSFTLLVVTIFWAAFCVDVVIRTINYPTAEGVIVASGTSILLGALITWNGQVITHWFRKKTPKE